MFVIHYKLGYTLAIRVRNGQDLLDVVEPINAGINVTRTRSYLEQYAADLVPLFDELGDEALQG